jgi:hypothetical protein
MHQSEVAGFHATINLEDVFISSPGRGGVRHGNHRALKEFLEITAIEREGKWCILVGSVDASDTGSCWTCSTSSASAEMQGELVTHHLLRVSTGYFLFFTALCCVAHC